MALDDETRKVAEECMGSNALRQVEIAAPDFFGRDYAILKLFESDEKLPGYPHVIVPEARVVASASERYTKGQVIDAAYDFEAMRRQGLAITVSPMAVREGVAADPGILETEPVDPVVVADAHDFWGSVSVFYSNAADLHGGRGIGMGRMDERQFSEGVCKCGIHFAFLPAGENPRNPVQIRYFERGRELIR